MPQPDIIYYDVAAVVITSVCLASVVARHLTRGPANRVYLSVVVLLLLTCIANLGGELYDAFLEPMLVQYGLADELHPLAARSALTMSYYALRSLSAPAYLVLIAAISDTSHRLNNSVRTRLLLWVPMGCAVLFVLANPFHQGVYRYVGTTSERGPLIWVLYGVAAYYSAVGLGWLFRWRRVMDPDEFSTLLLGYPLELLSVVIQLFYPHLRVEMFMSSVVMLLVSSFIMRPERQMDSLAQAASLDAYLEMRGRALVTDKPLCLVYLEIVNMERLRELVGNDVTQQTVRKVALGLTGMLQGGDVLYYLRNGLFCISARRRDAERARGIAVRAHEQGKARSFERHESLPYTEMRTCVVRIPEDVRDLQTLRAFVRRFSHLVPASTVTTYAELARRDDFELQMAVPEMVATAIRDRSFEVFYQPIRCMADGRFHSAEALVRLCDPRFGWVSPALFVPEAEQSGAIVQIGSILLDKVCEFLGGLDFDATGLDYVEVNLSVEQCVQPGLAEEVLGALRAHGVEPRRINLEITESSGAWQEGVVDRNVAALAEAGLSFSLDDYGTGYSNVVRMVGMPFSLIKLDKSLVDGMGDADCRTVLETSVRMIRSIGRQVLAEGVETREQAAVLAGMGVDYAQGYLYARPMPETEFVDFLRQHNR